MELSHRARQGHVQSQKADQLSLVLGQLFQDVGCVFREQLSSYLNDFGCSISHGQWTVETPRGS